MAKHPGLEIVVAVEDGNEYLWEEFIKDIRKIVNSEKYDAIWPSMKADLI